MIFIDALAMTRKYDFPVKEFIGTRRISYREKGDFDRDGNPVLETEVIGETLTSAWIQGSHDSRISLKCDGRTLTLSGNPGRFGRPDNLFNMDLDDSVAAANKIVAMQGYPLHTFHRGDKLPFLESQWAALDPRDKKKGKTPEQRWSGSRVWSIHLTENYETGSPENARRVIDWLNTQSVARVKKSRLGATTVVWGSIKYCQTEVYDKAAEMLAHCKKKKDKLEMAQTAAYKYALERGIIRVEVKCAKEFLKERQLTYLGNWDMAKVESIFRERTEVIERCKLDIPENEDALFEMIPKASRVHAVAWMSGIDVTSYMSRASFFRHAKVLREYGIDISEKRNVSVIRPTLKTVEIKPLEAPDWYSLAA